MTEKNRFKVGCIQFCADDELNENIQLTESLLRKTKIAGADLICLPEYFAAIEVSDDIMLTKSFTEEAHPALNRCMELADELSVWILCGSLPIKMNGQQVNNRSFLINNKGTIAAKYDKIHLFDVALDEGEGYQESDHVVPGDYAIVANLPWGRLGMTICYDVRFPHLFRSLAKNGAEFISVPAAFTQTTGEAHWHTLLRARAIETGSYIFAPCQNGVRKTGRATYGHSLVIDPWGKILADAGDEEGYIVVDVDPQKVVEARAKIPSLQHDRIFHCH